MQPLAGNELRIFQSLSGSENMDQLRILALWKLHCKNMSWYYTNASYKVDGFGISILPISIQS